MILGSSLYYFKTLTSTNSVASDMLRKKELPEGSVIYTDFQTAGKGQPGKKWESEAGKNLLFSVILYPLSVSPIEQFLLSMTISLGLCDFIGKYCRGSKIKWPNDIYVKNDKIAGILIENTIIDDRIESTVAGIGLNINQSEFPSGIPNPVSLKLLTGHEFDTGKCLKELLSDLDSRYKQLLYGDRKHIHSEYLKNIYRFNEYQVLRTDGDSFTGRIVDISLSGLLRVEDKNGKIREFTFREIFSSDTPN